MSSFDDIIFTKVYRPYKKDGYVCGDLFELCVINERCYARLSFEGIRVTRSVLIPLGYVLGILVAVEAGIFFPTEWRKITDPSNDTIDEIMCEIDETNPNYIDICTRQDNYPGIFYVYIPSIPKTLENITKYLRKHKLSALLGGQV